MQVEHREFNTNGVSGSIVSFAGPEGVTHTKFIKSKDDGVSFFLECKSGDETTMKAVDSFSYSFTTCSDEEIVGWIELFLDASEVLVSMLGRAKGEQSGCPLGDGGDPI